MIAGGCFSVFFIIRLILFKIYQWLILKWIVSFCCDIVRMKFNNLLLGSVVDLQGLEV